MTKRKQIEVLIDKYETPCNDYHMEDFLRDCYDVLGVEEWEYKAWEEDLEIHFEYMKHTFWIVMAIKSCKSFDIDKAFKIDWYNCIVPVEDDEVKEWMLADCND